MRFKPGNRWKSSRSEVRYRTWRKNVFELNKRKLGLSRGYVCVKCNKKRKTTRVLHAHHIYSWNKFPKKRYDKGGPVVTDPDFGRPKGTSFGPKSGKSLRARLLNIRLATKYQEFQPNYKPNPAVAKPRDFGVIKKKKGTEANPVNQNLRPAPKTPHSNKFMNKRLFAKDKKKDKPTEEERAEYKEEQNFDPPHPEELETSGRAHGDSYGDW